MKRLLCLATVLVLLGLAPSGWAGKGYMGGSGTLTPPPTEPTEPVGDTPPTDGPLNDQKSTAGQLFGDLYRIARYAGGETKKVPTVKADGTPDLVDSNWVDPASGTSYSVKRQGWTTAIAVGGEPKLSEEFASYTVVNEDTGEYEINPMTGGIYFPAPYPSQCVQPVADFERWGDILDKTGLDENRLPLTITYDPTWERSECAVTDAVFLAAGETWDGVTYYKEIRFPDLIEEVDFGRLNLGRAPDAVLDQAFDEAIRNINQAKTIALDAAGRLLLTTDIYDPYLTNPDGTAVLLETVIKAIDSPRENLALYLKLMQDGHLITPADERTAIDRSLNGGIPLAQLAEIEDGPSTVLRPTIDIDKMKDMGLGHLVDATGITTYYTRFDNEGKLVISTTPCDGCESSYGIVSRSPADECAGLDFPFSATFFASTGDKTGRVTWDHVVYMNSILGINKVIGYSAYDTEGEPADGAIDYSKNPVYFNFFPMPAYDRGLTFTQRGQVVQPPGGYSPGTYDGKVLVLVASDTQAKTWIETAMPIFKTVFATSTHPNGEPYLGANIRGFTTMADDDLRTIDYIHTYQIPGLR